jgi:CheY-like chemotaxis protein
MARVREEPLSRAEELAGFREAVSAEWVNLDAVIQDVLQTMAPLLSHSRVSIDYTAQADPHHLWLPGPILRQALLTLFGMAVRSVPAGSVNIRTMVSTQQIGLSIDASAGPEPISPMEVDKTAGVRITEELLHLCQGTLEVTWGELPKPAFAALILLPASEQATVLVVDDNADTRQLCQRYLVGSRYRFAGAQDARKGLALAKELIPDIIVLDVMIPGTDGWALLGQLREDPRTGAIPVVICTILAQRELALALGAAEFVRKPINRAAFLALLDRQLDRRHQGSG